MTGVQTLVPVMLDHVNAGRLSLARFVDLTSDGPTRLFGIARKGRIAAGYDADLTVVDLKRSETITDSGSPRVPAGRPMTACASPAGRSALSCAATGDVAGRAGHCQRPANRCDFWRRCGRSGSHAQDGAIGRANACQSSSGRWTLGMTGWIVAWTRRILLGQ